MKLITEEKFSAEVVTAKSGFSRMPGFRMKKESQAPVEEKPPEAGVVGTLLKAFRNSSGALIATTGVLSCAPVPDMRGFFEVCVLWYFPLKQVSSTPTSIACHRDDVVQMRRVRYRLPVFEIKFYNS